ncbi:RNA methyltransferase [Tropicimonas sp.]|uniref:RNA methyltransferase n=1 Tax=Tropicimonas sp. TaxID=2067044 RepID=UPI003A83545A
MPEPVFILVRPQMGENIGGAARAMLNFGLDRMRLVEPRDEWPNPRAVALASGAGRILDNAGLFETVADAIGDCTHVLATTARVRGLTKPVLTPEQAMAEARAATDAGGRVGILFGPERAGLENEDVARASAIVTVPVNPGFFSLNLAQCVLLMAYEWQRHGMAPAAPAELDRATATEIEKLGDHFEERLGTAGFFFPEARAPGMKLAIRNMLSRLALTRADVQIFHGMLRQLTRQKAAPAASDEPET